jgi:excinuclease ABC subunit C
MNPEVFKTFAPSLPSQPGIYKYFDSQNSLLYVGKAKNIKKRVSSYFNKQNTSYKTKELVDRIEAIEFTITESEQDALLLENALIKQHQPKFNIELKDDKSYPYIVIKKEAYPRVFLTRRKIADGSEYLGPFTSVVNVKSLLYLVRNHVQLRTCKLNLSAANIAKGKMKVCLEYHLGNCKGPCESLQTEEDYNEGLSYLRQIIKGNITPVANYYKQLMQQYATDLAFEKAAIIKKKLEHLEQYKAKSTIVNQHLGQLDVFSILKDGDTAIVNYLMVYDGIIVQTHNAPIKTALDETEAEILVNAIAWLREKFNSEAKEIVVPFEIAIDFKDCLITIPKAGAKFQLLQLSQKNVHYFKNELKQQKILKVEQQTEADLQQVLMNMQEQLFLPQTPTHIECFDNSNFQGAYPVSAMVCFKNGLPSKADYRHFNVKTVTGINDFATMKEVVGRRYKRLKEENQPLPQLVIIDGGKGQLSAAIEAIAALDLIGKMTLVGLAKNEEEIFFAGDSQSIKLPYYSNELKLIRRIRDEVHRFGITFHRQKRSAGTFKNSLENIPGIGKTTAQKLLTAFKSVKKIQEASLEAIANLVGEKIAQKIVEYRQDL